jgi:hypothetical protein
MGMDLSGPGGYFRWTSLGWSEILDLGEEFGWEPSGTGPPRGCKKAEWHSGLYHSNDGQLFYARDAERLADALERALAAIPERQPPKKGKLKVRYFTPEEAANIREFIAFCRAGSFRLY